MSRITIEDKRTIKNQGPRFLPVLSQGRRFLNRVGCRFCCPFPCDFFVRQFLQMHECLVSTFRILDQVGLNGRHTEPPLPEALGEIIGHRGIIVTKKPDEQPPELLTIGISQQFFPINSAGSNQCGVQTFDVIRRREQQHRRWH